MLILTFPAFSSSLAHDIDVAPVEIPEVQRPFRRDPAVIAAFRIGRFVVYAFEPFVVLAVQRVVMVGSGQHSPVDRYFPIFPVVGLPQTGQQDRVDGGLSRLVLHVAPVVDHAVHQCRPIDQTRAGEHVGGHVFRVVVDGHRGVGIGGEGGVVGLL